MLFYVLFISIIEHTEDDIYVPSLSANHPKIYLILSTLGYQKPVNHIYIYIYMLPRLLGLSLLLKTALSKATL